MNRRDFLKTAAVALPVTGIMIASKNVWAADACKADDFANFTADPGKAVSLKDAGKDKKNCEACALWGLTPDEAVHELKAKCGAAPAGSYKKCAAVGTKYVLKTWTCSSFAAKA